MILKVANRVPPTACRMPYSLLECLRVRTFHAPNITIKDTLKHHTPFSAIRFARLTTNSFRSLLSFTLIPALRRLQLACDREAVVPKSPGLTSKIRLLWKAYDVGP